MERRYTEQRLSHAEQRADGEKRYITGIASVFYDGTTDTEYELWNDSFGRAVERIMPTAFDRALAEKDDVRGLFNHQPDNLLGRTASGTMTLTKHDAGLAYDIQIGDSTVARNVTEFIERGDLTGSSFAFMVQEAVWREMEDYDVREIVAVELFDVGPVTYPAYTPTTAGVRAAITANRAAETDPVRAEWRAWKDSLIADQRRAELAERVRRTRLLLTRGVDTE